MADLNDLLKEVDEISTRTHLPYERRLCDTAVWFIKNKDRVPKEDVHKRLEFLEKGFLCMLELFAMSLDRQQQVENRPGSSLWLPNGLNARGDMTRFG